MWVDLPAVLQAGRIGLFGLDVDDRGPHQLDDGFQHVALSLKAVTSRSRASYILARTAVVLAVFLGC